MPEMSQVTHVRVLLVDDSDEDAQSIRRELERPGIECEVRRVDTKRALLEALRDFDPDIVLADHALPPFTAQEALALIRDERPRLPVVIVTGWLGGEAAAEYMKAGATDYVGKHHLFRLGNAVKEAVDLRRAHEEAFAAEAARARSDERARKLIEHAGDAITILAATGHITYSAGAVTQTLGYGIGELTGRNVFEIVHPDDRGYAQALLAEVLQSERALVRSTLRVRHKDGSWRYLDVVGANHLGDSGLDGIVVRYHDVTTRSRAEASTRAIEEQRRQTQRIEAISRLATKVAHDFNNILAVIRISCDVALLAVDEGDTTVRPELLTISRATKRGARLARELISSTRQEVGSRQRVDVNAFIARVIDMLRLLLGEHITVVFEPAPALGMAWVDPSELERVLTALTVNAGKAMPMGGTLTLMTRDVEVDSAWAEAHGVKPGPFVHLAIRDNSAVADPQERARALEHALTDETEETTDFGLATAHRVIERWGGFVRLDSEIDQGSTFHVFLPWQP
jgi:two-component system cell cycle sensor histidine kinase/response regulator CckA